MKSYFVLTIVSALLILTSCNQANNDQAQTQQTPGSTSATENLIQADTSSAEPIDATKDVETGEQTPETQTSGEQKQEVAMLNPPHGQPNHRCDIPVGAPLNSAPAPKTTNTTPASTTSTSATTSTVTNAANKPQVSSTTSGAVNNSFSPTVENASKLNNPQRQTTSTTANKGPKPATNPAHGQPYHRCDIAVGSPLP